MLEANTKTNNNTTANMDPIDPIDHLGTIPAEASGAADRKRKAPPDEDIGMNLRAPCIIVARAAPNAESWNP